MTRIKTFTTRLTNWNWWNELISIPIGLAAFYFYPLLAVKLEDDPAVWGIGTLQKFVFAFALVSIANGVSGLLVKLVVPNIFGFKNDEFTQVFQDLTGFQKCILLYLWFLVYFLGFILAANSL